MMCCLLNTLRNARHHQLRTGARKCTNRDVAPVNDPANTEHIRSYEVALLVRPLVAAGQFLNRYVGNNGAACFFTVILILTYSLQWSPLILDTVERKTNSLFTFPGPWHSFRWERATRALAAKNNLLFLMVCWLVASAICWLIGL